MTQLTAAERLTKVKYALYGDATPTYNDEQLTIFIDEVVDEMIGAGVKKEVAESTAAVGCIACGVNDLWNYSSGGVKHSEYFNRRVVQLSLRSGNAPTKTSQKHERIIVDHLTNTVELSTTYTDGAIIRIFVNGFSVVSGTDYTIRAKEITFTGTLIAGTEIDVFIYE